MKKRTKSLLAAFCTMALCGSLIAGSTYALFTDTANVNIAVTSGKVALSAEINTDSIQTYSAIAYNVPETTGGEEVSDGMSTQAETQTPEILTDEYGSTYIYATQDDGNFSNGGSASLSSDGTLEITNITPGDKVTFNITVTNSSNVAIKYRTVVTTTVDNPKDEDDNASIQNIMKALVVVTEGSDSSTTLSLNNTYSYQSAWGDWKTTDDKTKTLSVTVSLPINVTSKYANLKTNLKFSVEGVQSNAVTTSDEERVELGLDSSLEGENKTAQITANGVAYTVAYADDNQDGISILSLDTENATEVVIPSEINGIPVTSIGAEAFDSNTTITSVTIPDTVTEIGNDAFSDCANLSSVKLGDGITSLSAGIFSGCTNLRSLTLPNTITSIEARALHSSGIESIIIPSNVKEIATSSFFDCENLTSVTIEDGVEDIGYGAFANIKDDSYSSTISVTIPKSVKSIGCGAFAFNGGNIEITYSGTLEEWKTITKFGTSTNYEDLNSYYVSYSVYKIQYPNETDEYIESLISEESDVSLNAIENGNDSYTPFTANFNSGTIRHPNKATVTCSDGTIVYNWENNTTNYNVTETKGEITTSYSWDSNKKEYVVVTPNDDSDGQ
jgi:predicted ribosomally synthesized peptide with SipW-like signal peptide